MSYFDDIQFLQADMQPQCTAVLDKHFPATYSLEYIHSGRMFFGIDGGPQVILDRAAVFWHHPRHRYQYGAVDRKGWDHHWVLMRGPRAKRILEQALSPQFKAGYVYVPQPAAFAERFREFVALVREQNPLRHPTLVSKLERMIALLTEWTGDAGGPEPRAKELHALAASIRRAPYQHLDFDAVASDLHMSYSHFRRLFRRYIGKSPHDHLLLCRMQRAAQTLQQSGCQVKEVAYEAGYDDPAQFSKLFKKKIGLSPQQFRNALP